MIKPRRLKSEDFFVGQKMVCLMSNTDFEYTKGKVYEVVNNPYYDTDDDYIYMTTDSEVYDWNKSSLVSSLIPMVWLLPLSDLTEEDLFAFKMGFDLDIKKK